MAVNALVFRYRSRSLAIGLFARFCSLSFEVIRSSRCRRLPLWWSGEAERRTDKIKWLNSQTRRVCWKLLAKAHSYDTVTQDRRLQSFFPRIFCCLRCDSIVLRFGVWAALLFTFARSAANSVVEDCCKRAIEHSLFCEMALI